MTSSSHDSNVRHTRTRGWELTYMALVPGPTPLYSTQVIVRTPHAYIEYHSPCRMVVEVRRVVVKVRRVVVKVLLDLRGADSLSGGTSSPY
jgi:hypothetical protein